MRPESIESDPSGIFQFILSGNPDSDMLNAIAELSSMAAEREKLKAENEWLKRRIAEEDARIAHA